MRVAATADIHFTAHSYDGVREQMARVRDEADILVIAGDLTNYGNPEEMRALLSSLGPLRLPIVAVLGNHDYESGHEKELVKMMGSEGINVLDGSSYEQDGVGFAGTKGFIGGFGRGVLTAFGEKQIKAFVQASIDETLKLERAASMLRTPKIIMVTHYSPIAQTVRGEPPEIWPFLGSSRLAEVIDRHQAVLALHGHAHHGQLNGKTTGGVPVHNVALSLLLAHNPKRPYRVFEL
jgi:Icc-related predicted phosphoesterase